MSVETNSSAENTRSPKLIYLIVFVAWVVIFPVATVQAYLFGNGYSMFFSNVASPTMFVLGGILWLSSALGLWIMYDGMVNKSEE